jgi:hypothetical protein
MPATLSRRRMEVLQEHVARFVGETPNVFHELRSDRIHIDICVVPEVKGRAAQLLYTMGMSARAMPGLPPEARYAELFAILPSDWPLGRGGRRDERNLWPLSMLKRAARLPTEMRAAAAPGLSFSDADSVEPYAGTRFIGAVVGFPEMFPAGFAQVRAGARVTSFFPVLPLTARELAWKMEQTNPYALFERFDELGLDAWTTALIDPERPDFF